MSYSLEWMLGPAVLGIVLLPLVVPSFALIGVMVIALAAVAALVALAGAIFAMPYLLVRSLRRRVIGTRQQANAPSRSPGESHRPVGRSSHARGAGYRSSREVVAAELLNPPGLALRPRQA